MKTLYVVTSEDLETFVTWGKDGIEKALHDLLGAQVLDIRPKRNGDLEIKALDSQGAFELTAEPHIVIYGEQDVK